MHEAGKAGNEETIRMLIEAGANPKAKDLWGKTYEYYLKIARRMERDIGRQKKILDEAYALALQKKKEKARKKRRAAKAIAKGGGGARGK